MGNCCRKRGPRGQSGADGGGSHPPKYGDGGRRGSEMSGHGDGDGSVDRISGRRRIHRASSLMLSGGGGSGGGSGQGGAGGSNERRNSYRRGSDSSGDLDLSSQERI